ncbi:MAG TPA: mechanosensitive ion channel family protein [Candidatus Baltobacteraceae bacterium]
MHLDRVTLIGVNQINGEKTILTLALIAVIVIVRYALHYLLRVVRRFSWAERFRFWGHQAVNLLTTAFFIVALISIWVGPNAHWATVGGLIGAGIAFALQKFIIAIAGYIVILRGKTFSIGDRIIIGGVRGEVISLDFFQTTVLEMGQPPSVESETDPAMWVMARQYTGRIVVVTNGVIFDEPVYNYSRDFPFLWEEIHTGIGYNDKYQEAEAILLDVARKHTTSIAQMTQQARHHLKHVYDLEPPNVEPRVYYEMTDNWVDLALRFIVPDRGIREIKDAMYREILQRFKEAGIAIASGTYDIVGFPPVRIETMPAQPPADPKKP